MYVLLSTLLLILVTDGACALRNVEREYVVVVVVVVVVVLGEGRASLPTFFTAQHGMQTRSSDENSARLSVCYTRGL